MATAAPSAPPQYPTLLGTRRIPIDLGSQAFTLGGASLTFPLRKKGWLSALFVHVAGAYTVATATLVPNQLMPYNIITQFLLDGPGQTPPFRLGGFGLHVWNLVEKTLAPFVTGERVLGSAIGTLDANAYDASLLDQFGLTVGAATAHFWYALPFQRSSMDPRGVLGLGTDYQVNLILSFTSKAGLVTTAANLTVDTWTARVTQVYYTPVQPGVQDFDPLWSMVYDEQIQPIAAIGVQTVNINPGGRILGIAHGVMLNGAMDSADIGSATIQLNDSFLIEPKGLPQETIAFMQRYFHGFPLPVGVLLYDWDAYADDGAQDVRDWVNTQNIQTIQSTIALASGTLGTAPSIYTWTKRLLRLAA
ncbi:MAG: hypothetical protein ACYDCL_21450 [Myxococcales bacterium]